MSALTLLIPAVVSATCTLTAKCSGGDWSAAATWTTSGCAAGVTTPGNGCIIIIPACATVTVNINSPTYNNMEIYVYGTLSFDVGQKINMCPGYIKVFAGGQLTGGSPGSKINICGTTVWNGGGTSTGPLSYGGGTTLPVELLSFNAIGNGKAVDISWATASQTNCDYFTIERSSNSIDFSPVTVVDGAGSTSTMIEYAEKDYSPLSGISYYRLKQTDYDGHYIYSSIVAVNFSFAADGITVYPNPAGQGEIVDLKLDITGNNPVLVVIRDVTGREFYSKLYLAVEQDHIIAIDPDVNIAPGVYMITASSDNRMFSRKLVVR